MKFRTELSIIIEDENGYREDVLNVTDYVFCINQRQ